MTTAARVRTYVLLLMGIALMASPLVARTAGADAEAFTGFTFTADADGYTLTGGSPTSQAYPQVQGRVAHTMARLSTGPTGYALSSTMWPGALVANAGSLLALLGAPPEASALNYPIRAEASSPGGPLEAQMEPGMRAVTEGEVAEAFNDLDQIDDLEQLTIDSIRTHSRSEIIDGTGVSTGRSVVSGISIAGGEVTIESVVTEARATTDATSSDAGGSTVVTGLFIGGQEATVDEHGVHFGGQGGDPVDPVAQAIGENVLSHLGMELFVTRPATSTEPGSASYRSGSLVIVWDVFSQGEGIGVFAIGGAGASVQASEAVPVPSFDPPSFDPPSYEPPAFDPPVVSGSDFGPVDTGPVAAPASPPAAPEPADDQGGTFAAQPISADFFDGISPGLVLAAAAGALLAGRSLRRLHAAAVGGLDHTCPLEADRP